MWLQPPVSTCVADSVFHSQRIGLRVAPASGVHMCRGQCVTLAGLLTRRACLRYRSKKTIHYNFNCHHYHHCHFVDNHHHLHPCGSGLRPASIVRHRHPSIIATAAVLDQVNMAREPKYCLLCELPVHSCNTSDCNHDNCISYLQKNRHAESMKLVKCTLLQRAHKAKRQAELYIEHAAKRAQDEKSQDSIQAKPGEAPG